MKGVLQPGKDFINRLPDDVLFAILGRAFPSKVMRHTLVCRRWLRLAQHLQQAVIVNSGRSLHAGELLRSLPCRPPARNSPACTWTSRSIPARRTSASRCPAFLLWVPCLKELTLDCSLGYMATLPSSLSSLSSICVLKLSMLHLRVLPEEFGALRALEELYVNCPRLHGLLASVTRLTRLSRICLTDYCAMRQLPAQVGVLSALRVLQIHGWNRLRGILESIGVLKGLRRQDLRNIRCTLLDVGEECRKLEELRMENVHQGVFPPISLESFALLTILHCRSLRALPDNIGTAAALCELEIVDTLIVELSASTEMLTSLEWLVLAPSRKVRALPPMLLALPRVALVVLKNMSCLASMTEHAATSSPNSLPTLAAIAPSLRALTLADLPAFFSLPTTVCRLTALTSLSLLGLRHLKCLPLALSAVRTLKITGTPKLAALPESLLQLAALESLAVDDCPTLRSLPAMICSEAPRRRLAPGSAR
ncbi:unnamed protein product [Closterium sp. Naga37s-1]|nr:unnamed protein product [Closterium sp. Naga37s-1]